MLADDMWAVPDRAAFDERLAQEVSRSERSTAPFSIILLDIDGMNEINEQPRR